MHTLIKDISSRVDSEVTIKGWLYNKRSSGKIAFLELRDGSGFVQAVASQDDLGGDEWSLVEKVTQESSVVVNGLVKKHPKKEGVFELQVSGIEVIHLAEEYPITKKEHGPDFLLDNRHLWLRSKRQWAIQQIRDEVFRAITDFYHERGFQRVDTPILTPNACEGAAELFDIEYFDEGAVHLSQSGQLYLEAAIMSVGRGYDFGPVFRAEKSKTRKHLTEFWMMDAEAAYMEHDESMDLQEATIKAIAGRVLERCREPLVILERDTEPLEKMIELPFVRFTYTDAIKKLNELGSEVAFGDDLGSQDEELLTKGSPVPVFVHKWPKTIKPFYMKTDPDNSDLVLNNDLIGIEGAGEIIGGSQREDDYELLKAAIAKEEFTGAEYEWYLDLRKYGSVPHSGFGLGLERVVRWMAGGPHIRETIPFPRMINRIRP